MISFLSEKFSGTILLRSALFLIVTSPCVFNAQVYYSTDPDYLKIKQEQNNVISNYQSTYPDTSLLEFNNYFPRNFSGNLGLSSPDYILKYGTQDIGFRFFNAPNTNDRFDVSQVSYLRTKGPYASLTGIAGSKRFEIFKLLFSHTYRDKINITAGFQRYTSAGFYKRQQTYTNNFFLSSNYSNANQRFGYYLYVLNNGNKSQENGGITDGVLTDSSYKITKELFEINLNNAERDNRELRLMVNPWLRLNKKPDSLSATNHFLQLKSTLVNRTYSYKDIIDTSNHFYSNIYLDSVYTNDSTHLRTYLNAFSYALLNKSRNFGLSFGYTNEWSRFYHDSELIVINHLVHGDWTYHKNASQLDNLKSSKADFITRLNAAYVLEGQNAGNYKLESNSVWNFLSDKNSKLFLDALFENRNPDYMQQFWTGNNFKWNNHSFKNIKQWQAQLKYQIKKIRISALAQSFNHYIYYNSEALPQQSAKSIINLAVNFNYHTIVLKHLGFALNYLYQNTSDPTKVRIPANSAQVKLFYNGNLSNNNLQLQIGTQLSIYDSFTAYKYMPATQIFYLQESYKTEAYPYLDLYLNVRIRPVSFFVKVENILYGYAGPNYSLVNNYYQTDRAFRFGITWMFFD